MNGLLINNGHVARLYCADIFKTHYTLLEDMYTTRKGKVSEPKTIKNSIELLFENHINQDDQFLTISD